MGYSLSLSTACANIVPTLHRMPYAVTDHCLLKVNETTYFFAGGRYSYSYYSQTARLYNWETEEWTELAWMRQDK